jgi:hypothetical protein
MSSGLLQLNESPAKIFGMQEQHRLAMRADLWLAIAEHTGSLPFQLVSRGDDVIDLVADVVDAPVGIALEELRNR